MPDKYKAEELVIATRRLLATIAGKTLSDASDQEFFRCFSYAIRDIMMPMWKATSETYEREKPKQLYYFSMEYLMGRALGNNVINLKLQDVVREALEIMGKHLEEVEETEREAGLGSGGLGRLASCFLDSLATLHYPGQGYGLRYSYGIFAQEIRNGYQTERADRWLTSTNPWEIKRLDDAVLVEFGGNLMLKSDKSGRPRFVLKNCETIRAVPFDTPIVGYSPEKAPTINTLRLWSADEEPRNFGLIAYNQGEFHKAFRNNTITYVLYPDDSHQEGKILRLKQQFFLISASLQDIFKKFKKQYNDFSILPEKIAIQINDTHPTLVIPELLRILTQNEALSWNEAWEITRKTVAYTNHTLMSEALETWNTELFRELLPRQYEIILRVDRLLRAEVRANFPGDDEKVQRMSIITDGVVRMAHLAAAGSHSVNGVAALHTELLKTKTLKDFHDLYPDKFLNITNGITPRRWLLKANPSLASLLTSRIGDGWITDLRELSKLKAFASDPEFVSEFQRIKHENKVRLADFVKAKNPYRDSHGKPLYTIEINPDTLFDIQIKRLHEYKRQLMNILHIMMLYNYLKENPDANFPPRTFIFAAKASAAYVMAKNIIKLINNVARKIHNDPDVCEKIRVVFIENYNVSKAELLFPAADLSEQISTASMEASGTGNMKFTLNGALTIGTEDGANVEMKKQIGENAWPFAFGLSATDVLKHHALGDYDPKKIFDEDPEIRQALSQLIDGTYTENEEEEDILQQIYLNLLEGYGGSIADNFFVLKDLRAYTDTQKSVSKLYRNREEWARLAIMNMAGIGEFSTDVSIQNYATKIWNIKPLAVTRGILEEMKRKYGFRTSK